MTKSIDLGARVIAGVSVPDSPLITEALEYAQKVCEPYLFNHAVRSWLFAAKIGQSKGIDCDLEVVAVGTILHDIGLSAAVSGSNRFEVNGAAAARSFVKERGISDRRAQLIWDLVAHPRSSPRSRGSSPPSLEPPVIRMGRSNQWALSGEWTIGKQGTVLTSSHGRIVHRFHARDLHLVMGPAQQRAAVRFRVSLDGQRPGAARGLDVNEDGNGTVAEPRMYQLIRQPGSIGDRTFEIEFLGAGVEAFAFTFG
jgi:hypothetical protein